MKGLFGREVEGMHAAAYILGASALASSALALLRDRLFAHAFGAGPMLDSYYAAFRIPDIIFVTAASLFSAYALIPILARGSDDEQHRYIDTVSLGFGAMMFVISGVAYFAMPLFISHLFPSLEKAAQTVMFSRILLLQPILLGFSNILAAITQVEKQYFRYALAPVLYNAGIIMGLVIFYPVVGPSGLVWGVVAGALMHVAIQLPGALSRGFFSRMRFGGWGAIVETLALSLPRTLALSVTQIVQTALIVIAGTLTSGSIAVFTFAYNLQAVPLAVIGASYSVAAFPTLSKLAGAGDMRAFVGQVVSASRHIFFWSMPLTALMVVLRAHIVRTILGSGAFDWTDTRLTAASFAFMSAALVASALSLLLIRAYYAAGRSYMPLAVTGGTGALAIALVLTLLAADGPVRLFLESLMRVEDVPGTMMLLLPMGTAAAAISATIIFVILFERHFGGFIAGISRVFWESITAAGFAGAIAYAVLVYVGGITPLTTVLAVVTDGTAAGLAGLAAAGMVYWFFDSSEFREALDVFRKKPEAPAPVTSAEETITT